MRKAWKHNYIVSTLLFLAGISFYCVLTKKSIQNIAPFVYHIVPEQQLVLIIEPKEGIVPILASIKKATKSIDVVMYELEDEDIEKELAAAAGRGVSVRVILNGGLYGKGSKANQPAFSYFQAHHIPVKWSPAYFSLTHQKTIILDAQTAVLLTFNLTPKYYALSRDFAVIDEDSHDVSAIQSVFTDDWQGVGLKTPAREFFPEGDDLVWSPNAKYILLAAISSASSSLEIASEELEDPDCIAALAAAAGRGVHIQILMTDSSQWHQAFRYLASLGIQIRTYPKNQHSLYIHEKIFIIDDTQVFLGSQNLSTTSLVTNRELGLFISTPSSIETIKNQFLEDWNNAPKVFSLAAD